MNTILIDQSFIEWATIAATAATRSIDITTFKAEVCHKQRARKLLTFFETLKQRAGAGVRIRILINWNEEKRAVPKTNIFAAQWLTEAGVDVRHLRNNRCCHTKLIIIDNQVAAIGSHNLSVKSISDNFEITLATIETADIRLLSEIFCRIFNDAINWK
jgi:phosphatidylserine/phosphatidylglycerophosphate/cardiolipin synthase-like enzyme